MYISIFSIPPHVHHLFIILSHSIHCKERERVYNDKQIFRKQALRSALISAQERLRKGITSRKDRTSSNESFSRQTGRLDARPIWHGSLFCVPVVGGRDLSLSFMDSAPGNFEHRGAGTPDLQLFPGVFPQHCKTERREQALHTPHGKGSRLVVVRPELVPPFLGTGEAGAGIPYLQVPSVRSEDPHSTWKGQNHCALPEVWE